MLLKFCLQNRWVKAALTVTECQVGPAVCLPFLWSFLLVGWSWNGMRWDGMWTGRGQISMHAVLRLGRRLRCDLGRVAQALVFSLQAMVLNGLWDAKDDECRELMRTRMAQSGLKMPKLSIAAKCPDCRPGQKVHCDRSRYILLASAV